MVDKAPTDNMSVLDSSDADQRIKDSDKISVYFDKAGDPEVVYEFETVEEVAVAKKHIMAAVKELSDKK